MNSKSRKMDGGKSESSGDLANEENHQEVEVNNSTYSVTLFTPLPGGTEEEAATAPHKAKCDGKARLAKGRCGRGEI